MKRMLSGIKPSGQLTLGNYLGALKYFVDYQNEYEMFVFIANLHCLTEAQDPIQLNKNLKDAIALYLACGLDENKSTIFLQSDVTAQAQLGFIMCCNTYLGELNRMTQFKDKMNKGESNLSGGIYTYPTLMAADILAYQPDFVPVGDDQKQHVELTRDLALRLNNRIGEVFKIPTPLIPKVGARIMSLQNPTKKMSKSEQNNKGCIYLLDDVKIARKKIMSAVTDSENKVYFDPINKAGISNLMQIYSSITSKTFDDIEQEFKDSGYGNFKKSVADEVEKLLTNIQSKYQEIIASNRIETVLKNGSLKAKNIADKTLKDVQQKLGIEL